MGRNSAQFEKGQALIILLLILLVALTVGLAITQRSLSGVATSNKVDQSSRAFSAAEAGIEKAMQLGGSTTVSPTELQSQATATVKTSGLLPKKAIAGQPGQALEYPPIGKESVAQVWLADPKTLATVYPSNTNIDIYFGKVYTDTQNSDVPAIEVSIISSPSANNFISTKYFYDPVTSASRQTTDHFTCDSTNPPACAVTPSCPFNLTNVINTTNSPSNTSGPDRSFRCKITITTPTNPIMIRARVLYTNTTQPIAVAPVPANVSLPPQAQIYTSIGSDGTTQQKIQVFKIPFVVPAYFDYAIFSAGNITKAGN